MGNVARHFFFRIRRPLDSLALMLNCFMAIVFRMSWACSASDCQLLLAFFLRKRVHWMCVSLGGLGRYRLCFFFLYRRLFVIFGQIVMSQCCLCAWLQAQALEYYIAPV